VQRHRYTSEFIGHTWGWAWLHWFRTSTSKTGWLCEAKPNMDEGGFSGPCSGVNSCWGWSKFEYSKEIVINILTPWQAFRIVNSGPFRCLLNYQRPQMCDSDLLHCSKIHEQVLEKAKRVQDLLQDKYKVFLACEFFKTSSQVFMIFRQSLGRYLSH